jgi:ribosome biogenesis protein SSF1/2
MPKRGRSRKKNRTQVEKTSNDGTPSAERVPKSLIVRRGKIASELSECMMDLRRMMMPYTAMNFQDTNANMNLTLSQYCAAVALPMGITHILQLSQKEDRCNMRIARVPEGPTLYFRVYAFTLIRHIQSIQRRPISIHNTAIMSHPPIVVTNNFGDHTAPPHVKLLRITFQNLFPQINVSTVKLRDCRRVVLFNLIERTNTEASRSDSETAPTAIQLVEMRHYAIKATPVGIDRKVRRLIQSKLPNLHNVNDIADYITHQSNATSSVNDLSDSEPEDDPEHIVQLSDNYVGAGCKAKQKSALKLVEVGPRLTMQLVKVEKGLDSNSTTCLYNLHVTKTKEDVEQKQAQKEKELQMKEERRKLQEQNVERKRLQLEEKREAKRLKLQQKQEKTNRSLQDELKIEGVSSDEEDSTNDGKS